MILKNLLLVNRFNLLRLFAVVLTIFIIVVHKQIPERTVTLIPSELSYHSLYGPDVPSDTKISKNVYWLDDVREKWYCNNPVNYTYSCGYAIAFFNRYRDSLDFSEYHRMLVHLKHSGDAAQIRISLRNYNPQYVVGDRVKGSKFMSVLVPSSLFEKPISIALKEFTVAEWWMREFNIDKKYSAPEFDRVISLGIDYLSQGKNIMEVKSIVLYGPWITSEQLYFYILIFWLAIILWETSSKFFFIYRKCKIAERQSEQLAKNCQRLEQDKNTYRKLSTTDSLTGVLNRAGINEFAKSRSSNELFRNNTGFLIFDIDHFKKINDSYGHDTGDKILIKFTEVIQEATLNSDIFGRWGGEEFILICPLIEEYRLRGLCERLRARVEQHRFFDNPSVTVTVSIGATVASIDEPFETTFKRIDDALYAAKNNGRNKFVIVE